MLEIHRKKMNGWCEKAGGNITIDYIARSPKEPVTKLDGNPFWMAIKGVFDSMQVFSQVHPFQSFAIN